MSFPRLDGIGASKARQEAMTAPGDSGRASRCPGQFPVDDRQHVTIARPVVGGRRLLLAGKPSGPLDWVNREAVVPGQRRSVGADDPRRCTRGAAAVAGIYGAVLAWRADRVVSIGDGRVTGHHLQERTRWHG